ncbi:MAG TPA: phenylalanine--tRNA ligase beta subunit-related protein [bacterium]|nr:phenylalanine--tRNA ligase beta subunit-related protein [bacterium]
MGGGFFTIKLLRCMHVLIRISDSLKRLGVHVAYSVIDAVTVAESGDVFTKELGELEEVIRREGDTKTNPVAQAYRRFYWSIGLDPTKIRPAGEALRRRVLNGGRLPKINSVVDAGNYVSAKTLVPIGLYDTLTLSGNLMLKHSEGDELFLAIGSSVEERLPPGVPILIDCSEANHALHLFPHRDSQRTKITNQTKSVLVVGAGVEGVDPAIVQRAVKSTIELTVKYSGGFPNPIMVA